MKTRLLYTESTGTFREMIWEKPDHTSTEIEVKALMTGICRSDIDMMQGNFGPLPLHMQGHEGLGVVTRVGADVMNVKTGDIVATRGEPAYSDFYNVRDGEFVVVPEVDPKYILEPVACGINCIVPEIINGRSDKRTLILGSGFLAWVVYNTLKTYCNRMETIDVLGSSNIELWGDQLLMGTSESYDNVIDLSGKYELGTEIELNNNALIVDAVGKSVSKKEAQAQLWKACTTVRPSPRSPNFIDAMYQARYMIERGELDVSSFWTKGYDRNTEWQEAFQDGVNRPDGYSRGYLIWP